MGSDGCADLAALLTSEYTGWKEKTTTKIW